MSAEPAACPRARLLYLSINDGSDTRINKEIATLSRKFAIDFVGIAPPDARPFITGQVCRVELIHGRRRSMRPLAQLWWRVLKLLAHNRYDSVHVINENLYLLLWPLLLGQRVVLDVFDSWFLKSRMSGWLVGLGQRLSYALPAKIIVTDDERAGLMPEFTRPKLVIIPNYPFRYTGPHQARDAAIVRVLYAGSLSARRGTEFVARLLAAAGDVHVVMAGWIRDQPTQDLCAHPRVEWLGILPQQEIIAHATRCNFILCHYEPVIANNIYASPNKIYDAIQAGCAVIINPEVRVSRFVREHDLGVILDAYEPSDMKAVTQALRDFQARYRLGPHPARTIFMGIRRGPAPRRPSPLRCLNFAPGIVIPPPAARGCRATIRSMKQILQNLANGETLLAEVPAPGVPPGGLRIATRATLVSLGTERMLLEFGRANLLEKARQQPDKVHQVFAKIKTEGLFATIAAVRTRLAEPLVLGYCNAGIVLEVGAGVQGWRPGDRVLSNGPHAEVVAVPANLCAKIPDAVPDAHAPFAVTGAIALQGIRLLQPTLGECFMVTGLGLIGLLAVQLLKAHGCRVLGVDYDSAKCALARQFGAETVDLSRNEDPVALARAFTGGRGLDGVLITASTKSCEPIAQAAQASRKRGRIVLVGVAGLELNRADFYEKELTFQVSCSYGPGRYDPEYEIKGHDYPLPFVRWTEQRNFEAVLAQMASGAVAIAPLITRRIPFDHALQAYEAVSDRATLGLVLEYEVAHSALESTASKTIRHAPGAARPSAGLVVGVLGAGDFATRFLLPALQRHSPPRFKAIVSARGVTAAQAARRFGFAVSSTDPATVLADPEINVVFIASYDGAHASQTLAALAAGKHVFVEKPLCLTLDELAAIELAAAGARSLLMVGYNRRFSPHLVKMKSLLEGVRAPRAMIYTLNTGHLPASHWQFNPLTGGGRLIGEACHFVDTLRFLAGAPIVAARADFLGGAEGRQGDVVALHLRFADGSIGTVHYLANGNPKLSKERLEVFCAGRILQMDNFRRLTGYGWNGFKNFKTWSLAKGHQAQYDAFVDAVRQGRPSPIPPEEIFEISRATINLAQAQTASSG